MILEPEVVVVAKGVAKQPLVIAGSGRAYTRGKVERVTRDVLIELGKRMTTRDGIEIPVLQRHWRARQRRVSGSRRSPHNTDPGTS